MPSEARNAIVSKVEAKLASVSQKAASYLKQVCRHKPHDKLVRTCRNWFKPFQLPDDILSQLDTESSITKLSHKTEQVYEDSKLAWVKQRKGGWNTLRPFQRPGTTLIRNPLQTRTRPMLNFGLDGRSSWRLFVHRVPMFEAEVHPSHWDGH